MILLLTHQPLPFPVTFSNPPHAFIHLISIGVYRDKHATQLLPIQWSFYITLMN